MTTMWRIGLAVVLITVAMAGLLHGTRAAVANAIYYRAKFGSLKDRPDKIIAACEQAHRLYPFQHRFCLWTAEQAYVDRFDAAGRERPDRLAAAETWCRRGLTLQPYSQALHLLNVRLTARASLRDAIDKWDEYVDWHFWDPYNHAVRVELYSRVGRFGEAAEALTWVRGSEYFQEARQTLDDAMRRDREWPLP